MSMRGSCGKEKGLDIDPMRRLGREELRLFDILSHKGDADENNTEIPSPPSQSASHQGNKQQQLLIRMQEKGTLRTSIRTCCTTLGHIPEGTRVSMQ
jgi:hypothetical protein